MTPEEGKIVDVFQKKVEKLIAQYIVLQNECDELNREKQQLRETNEQLESRIQELEKNIDYLKMANAIHAGDGNDEAKMKISYLVREIDKCIALLNN